MLTVAVVNDIEESYISHSIAHLRSKLGATFGGLGLRQIDNCQVGIFNYMS